MMDFEIFNGRVAADVELREVATGKVANVRIATDRPKKENEDKPVADFYNVTFWNKAAEVAADRAKKGKKIIVRGYVMTRAYEDKEGKKRVSTDYVGKEFVVA